MANLDKLDWTIDSDKQAKLDKGEYVEDLTSVNPEILLLYTKLNESLDKSNVHISDIASMKSDISSNNAKTGITTTQADAITANTAKTGITTTQATQLSNLNAGRASSVATNIKNVTAQITQIVNVNAKTGAATLNSTILLSNGTRYTLSQTLTKVSK
tara:strand:+ start:1773 stop:2246 length:474 start_codon:yes stop_codon:yes gene_type:complete